MLHLLLGIFTISVGAFCLLYVFNKRVRQWYEEMYWRHSRVDRDSLPVNIAEGMNAILLPVVGALFTLIGLAVVIGAVANWF